MKKMLTVLAMGVSVVVFAGCGAQQSQAPQTDDQPETVIVYRDGDGSQNGGASGGNGGNASGASNEDTSSGGSASSGSSGGDADDNMRATDQIPEGFPVPIPDDYQVERAGETARELAVDLQTPSGQEAYDYYEQALRDEGFDIEEAEIDRDEGQFDANIDFRNSDYDGDIDFNGDYLEIDVELLNPTASSGSSGGSGNSSGGSSGSSGGSSGGGLPSGFPVSIPGDYQVEDVREGSGEDSGDIDVMLSVPDGRQAFDYYSQNIESDGFRIEETDIDNDSSRFEGDIDFDGADYDGNIDINGNMVEIDLERYGN